jgi:hypothetical protein
MCQEYTINHKYILIIKQRIQTTIPQFINRIEIGWLVKDTPKYFHLITESGKRRVKKLLVTNMTDITYDIGEMRHLCKTLEDALI